MTAKDAVLEFHLVPGGEILAPGDGSIIAVGNVRHPPEGIRLWRSPDGGKTWDPRAVVQMWDARSFRMLGQAIAAEPSGRKPLSLIASVC